VPDVRDSPAESETTGGCPAASPTEHPVHAPTSWGRFTLVREIGRGAFGVVYEAVDPDLQRAVALKLIRPRPPGAVNLARALDEARLLARIRHPNVVTVYGAERTDDEVALWMDLIRGHTLHELVARSGPLGAREAALVGLDLCRALAAIHGAGLVHGDLKAHNVMREDGGRIVLMDFGAGKDISSREHRAHDFVGTPVYVAPEVFEGRQRTPASDIYSLGVLLFYLVTGRYPIEGRTLSEVEAQHRHGTQRRLRDVRPDLPEAFVGVVQRALAREPEGRQQSAGELETALLQVLAGTGTPRARRWFKAPLAVAAMLIVAMLGGAAVLMLVVRLGGTDAPQPRAASRAETVIPPAPSPTTEAEYRVQAGLYRINDERRVRLRSNDRVSPGDRLSLDIEVSRPAHVYVVNEDDAGDAYLLFPLPGQTLQNPIPSAHHHHLPGIVNGREMYWQVTSAGGREHLLVFVSPEEVPVFAQLATRLPRPTAGKPVTEARVPQSATAALRGIGGLAAAPPPATGLDRLSARFTVPLPDSEETASGLWVRQITFENPGK
jgi:serine/threonine-protein kinase